MSKRTAPIIPDGTYAACAFCGTDQVRLCSNKTPGACFSMACQARTCQARGPWRASRDEALEAWNSNRPLIPPAAIAHYDEARIHSYPDGNGKRIVDMYYVRRANIPTHLTLVQLIKEFDYGSGKHPSFMIADYRPISP